MVSSIADRLSIPKADILNAESSNAAVKLALAETHVIQETKSYFESQGVILSSFSSRGRSDTIILVKNIPYGTSSDQIRELFEAHGKLSRVIVPPAGTMAVVEFEHAVEASKAFRAIAYRRLGNSVIYLEKGPLGMFQDVSEDTEPRPVTTIPSGLKPLTIAEQETPDSAGDEEVSLSAGSTLFVKNLAFSTTTERLKQVFRNLPDFAFARVQTKPDPKRPAVPGNEAPRLSMGYGFVGFKTVEGAKKALKGMQGFTLDGHALHVKFAGRGTEEDESKNSVTAKSRTTKMIVKNVPFEATKRDIRELFGYVFRLCLPVSVSGGTQVSFPKAHTVNSSLPVYRSGSTPGRADLRSLNSSRDMKLRMRMLRFGTHTCSDGILFWNGPRRQSRTWMLYGRRRVSGLVVEVHYQVKRGDSIWTTGMASVKKWTSLYFILLMTTDAFNSTMRVSPRWFKRNDDSADFASTTRKL